MKPLVVGIQICEAVRDEKEIRHLAQPGFVLRETTKERYCAQYEEGEPMYPSTRALLIAHPETRFYEISFD